MNKVILIGRLTADPEVRYTADQKAVANYTLAVDRRAARNAEGHEADFIRCIAWEKRAEFAEKYLKKGTKVAVLGRIQTGSYTGKDGKKVYTTDVIVEEVEFAGSRPEASEQAAPQAGCQEPQARQQTLDEFMQVPDDMDDLPFN